MQRDSLDRDEHESVDQRAAKNVSVLQVLPWQVLDRSHVLLPKNETDKADATEHKHGNDVASLPAVRRGISQAEGKKNEGETSRSQKETDDWKDFRVSMLLLDCENCKGQLLITYHQTRQHSA